MIDREDENHELDDFIRQKLSNIQVPFDEQAWLDLQKKLQAHNRAVIPTRQVSLTWTKLAAASVLLLAMPAFLWAFYYLPGLWNEPHATQTEKTPSSEKYSTKYNPKNPQTSYDLNSTDSLFTDSTSTNYSAKTPTPETTNARAFNSSKDVRPFNDFQTSKTLPKANQTGISNLQNVEPVQTQFLVKEESVNAFQVNEQNPEFAKDSGDDTFETTNQKRFLLTLTELESLGLKYPSVDTPVPYPSWAELSQIPSKKRKASQALYVGMSYAPELDLISLAKENLWSSNTGIMAEWSFSPKFDLRIGVSYSHKGYHVIDFNNAPPPTSVNVILNSARNNLVIAESMVVNSELLDIPVELKYVFNRRRKVRFFVHGGFSNYLFLNQDIEAAKDIINPKTSFRALLSKEYSEVKEQKFFGFSTLNTGMGVEMNIRPYLKAQLNPYYKFALRSAGAEGNQISSFGIRTSLLYAAY